MSSYPQTGITNRPPEHLILATFRFLAEEQGAARASLAALGSAVERELNSDLDRTNPPEAKENPSEETGELGFEDDYDRAHLTITLGISSSGFDKLGVAAEERPQDLRPIPWSQLGDEPANAEFGDVILQICSDDLYVCEHVVRRVEEELGHEFALVSTTIGSQRYNSRPGRTSKREGRALIGFLDGTSNLNPRNSDEDAALVFVDPEKVGEYPQNPPPQPPPEQVSPYGGGGEPGHGPHFPADLAPVPTSEPEWAKNGTYMTVRTSTFNTTAWDDLSQNAQEASVGRFKVSGTSLDLADDSDLLEEEPKFASEQTNTTVGVAAHIRKAHPRGGEEDEQRRIFRRGYPLIAPGDGALKRGLVFVAFARTITTQFEFIFRAWMRNPDFPVPGAGLDTLLFEKLGEQVLGGGYYFVPPLEHKTKPWSWRLPF